MAFRDGFGRVHDDLRISVTDRCNMRCTYCMPAEPEWFPQAEVLSYEEIARLARLAVSEGVRKLRLTGGEPLMRRGLPELIRMLAEIPGVEDLSLTTNGMLLGRFARELAQAGLRRVNVSLDTLDRERFEAITRRDALQAVLEGLAAAKRAGLHPVKLNAVVLRGINEADVEPLVERARSEGWELRFIEFMPLDNERRWRSEQVVSGAELRERISARWPLVVSEPRDPHAPAVEWRFADTLDKIGFIDSVSAPFCERCSRLRLTSDGVFRVCLYDDVECDLKTPLRTGASDAALAGLMRGALERKGRGGALEIIARHSVAPQSRTMHQIGG